MNLKVLYLKDERSIKTWILSLLNNSPVQTVRCNFQRALNENEWRKKNPRKKLNEREGEKSY